MRSITTLIVVISSLNWSYLYLIWCRWIGVVFFLFFFFIFFLMNIMDPLLWLQLVDFLKIPSCVIYIANVALAYTKRDECWVMYPPTQSAREVGYMPQELISTAALSACHPDYIPTTFSVYSQWTSRKEAYGMWLLCGSFFMFSNYCWLYLHIKRHISMSKD